MSVKYEQAVSYLRRWPAGARARIMQVMQWVGFDLQGAVQTTKLQGQVLNHRSGWLSSHVHPNVSEDGAKITTTVGVDKTAVPYAAIHEYGFQGIENVKAHTRLISLAFGKPITPTTVNVSAFSRAMNMPERSYLRSTLSERRDMYVAKIAGVLKE